MKRGPKVFDRVCSFVWFRFRDCLGGKEAESEISRSGVAKVARPMPPSLHVPGLAETTIDLETKSALYANRYRSGFLVTFVLGFVAVFLAASPLLLDEETSHHFGWGFTLAEAVCILLILATYLAGRENPHHSAVELSEEPGSRWNQAWRRRWMENRLKAEQFRYAELLLGFPGEPIDLKLNSASRLDERLTREFTRWYVGARERAARETASDMTSYRSFVLSVIDSQIDYHELNARRCDRIHHRLHTIATACFWTTLAVCVSHFFFHAGILSALAVSLPAAAAALHGILGAGEFATLSKQSEEMVEALEEARSEIEGAAGTDIDTLRENVQQLYRLFVSEASGWHVALRSKDIQIG